VTVSDTAISRRKEEHLQIVLDRDVSFGRSTLLPDVHLVHEALPEVDLEEIDLTTEFFGKRLAAPFIIPSMSGGAKIARRMNHELADVAERCGVALAVGSQRIMLDHPEVREDFAVRSSMPNGVLLANIGAAQLAHRSTDEIASLVQSIEADGLCVHLNPAQELVQPEGDRRFRGQLEGIARLVDRLQGRLLVKETGAGLAPRTLRLLHSVGVTVVDVAGAGGTSWTKVEMFRIPYGEGRRLGETFADWGVPTAFSILAARKILGEEACVIASGGLQTGLDCAKSFALGASLVGCARPLLLAWHRHGIEGARSFLAGLIYELRSAMLLTGCCDLAALRKAPRVITGELRHWLSALPELG
jgi:isopentenyl-diphosphate Delta-isomerase